MTRHADTNYSFNPWMDPKVRPGDGVDPSPVLNGEETVIAMMEMSPVPLPAEFTPRLGYENREPTIDDVFNIGAFTIARDTPTRQDSGMQGTFRS